MFVKFLKTVYRSIFGWVEAFNWFHNYVYLKAMRVEIDRGSKINGRLTLINNGELIIGAGVVINSAYRFNPIGGNVFTSIVVQYGAKLLISDNVGISNSAIYCVTEIVIGRDVMIGGDCKIYDTDFHSIAFKDRMCEGDNGVSKPVFIADGVFIGTGSIILKGVSIGENSIVGAGSVVSSSIPANEIWAGNPAKFIRVLD